jgi:hypothetical protein
MLPFGPENTEDSTSMNQIDIVRGLDLVYAATTSRDHLSGMDHRCVDLRDTANGMGLRIESILGGALDGAAKAFPVLRDWYASMGQDLSWRIAYLAADFSVYGFTPFSFEDDDAARLAGQQAADFIIDLGADGHFSEDDLVRVDAKLARIGGDPRAAAAMVDRLHSNAFSLDRWITAASLDPDHEHLVAGVLSSATFAPVPPVALVGPSTGRNATAQLLLMAKGSMPAPVAARVGTHLLAFSDGRNIGMGIRGAVLSYFDRNPDQYQMFLDSKSHVDGLPSNRYFLLGERMRDRSSDYDWSGPAWDSQGILLLGRWRLGRGAPFIIDNDPEWTQYLGHNPILMDTIDPYILAVAREAIASEQSSLTYNIRTHAEIQNSARPYGHGYLHGTNADVGGFGMSGTAIVEVLPDGGCRVTINGEYTWNDIVDPNPEVSVLERILDWVPENPAHGPGDPIGIPVTHLPTPTSYEVHISWDETTVITFDASGSVVSVEGYLA